MPTPLRTPQTSGHSSFRVSNLPLWSLKSPPSHESKIIFFHLSQSKCTVSALFLHGFTGCNGHSDLQNATKGAEIAGRKITMLCAKKQRKLESFKIRVPSLRGSFNQRARDSSSLERTKITRRIVRFIVDFPFSGALHTFAHRRESRVFLCIVCILCIVSRACRGEPPPSRLQRDRSFA